MLYFFVMDIYIGFWFCIQGPGETPYQGGVFQLAINVPEQYPLVPPQVRFVTKIFHPNVHFKVMFAVYLLISVLLQLFKITALYAFLSCSTKCGTRAMWVVWEDSPWWALWSRLHKGCILKHIKCKKLYNFVVQIRVPIFVLSWSGQSNM